MDLLLPSTTSVFGNSTQPHSFHDDYAHCNRMPYSRCLEGTTSMWQLHLNTDPDGEGTVVSCVTMKKERPSATSILRSRYIEYLRINKKMTDCFPTSLSGPHIYSPTAHQASFTQSLTSSITESNRLKDNITHSIGPSHPLPQCRQPYRSPWL